MTIIPLDFSIHRDSTNGKKFYTHIHTKKKLNKPILPKGWQTTEDFDSIKPKQAPSHAIRCDDDLIVIDCDDMLNTEFINDKLVPTPETKPDHYIIQSDKGERHFYFKPTEYYKNSSLYKDTRLAIGKLDVLHGRSLVFAPCTGNETKQVLSGSLTKLTNIPNNIVDALVDKLKVTTIAPDSDYKPLASYLAPKIEQTLALYSRSRNYLDMQPIMMLITPSKYKHMVEPSYHPDNVDDGEGINYLQALSSKVAQDPSISVELHTELLSVISQVLWSDPLSDSQLKTFLSNLTTQTYNATGKPVFVYNENVTNQPLVSVNDNEYMPLYRTLDDEYIIAKPHGSVEVIKGVSNFKKAMASKNYDIIVDGKKIPVDNNIGLKKVSEALKTARIRNVPYEDTGEYEEDGSLYYNIYRPTKYLGIIRGAYKQDSLYKGPDTHKTITYIIKNLMYDHQGDEMYEKFIKFLAHKLKTLDYSPIVFQMMGNKGVGKSLLMSILDYLTDGMMEVKLSKSNAQFNEEQESSIFLNEDEGVVTSQLINNIKAISGKKARLIEAKGKTPYIARNVSTYICTTNKTTPMAETIDDRRFVTLSSFKANRLSISDVEVKIALELEAFALCLRETKLNNHKIYMDANEWHDSIHFANFTEKQESTQDLAGRLASLMYNLNTYKGSALHKELEDILGDNYHYVVTKKASLTLGIPLSKHPKMVRQSDQSQLTHEITREQLKAVGIDEFIKQDKNGTKSTYSQNFYKLELTLSPTQMELWQATYDGYSVVEGGEDIDL